MSNQTQKSSADARRVTLERKAVRRVKYGKR